RGRLAARGCDQVIGFMCSPHAAGTTCGRGTTELPAAWVMRNGRHDVLFLLTLDPVTSSRASEAIARWSLAPSSPESRPPDRYPGWRGWDCLHTVRTSVSYFGPAPPQRDAPRWTCPAATASRLPRSSDSR